jgi:hypothetical protein
VIWELNEGSNSLRVMEYMLMRSKHCGIANNLRAYRTGHSFKLTTLGYQILVLPIQMPC